MLRDPVSRGCNEILWYFRNYHIYKCIVPLMTMNHYPHPIFLHLLLQSCLSCHEYVCNGMQASMHCLHGPTCQPGLLLLPPHYHKYMNP